MGFLNGKKDKTRNVSKQNKNRFQENEKLWEIFIFLTIFLICIVSLELFFRIFDINEDAIVNKFQTKGNWWQISDNPILLYEPKPNTIFKGGRHTNEDGFWRYGYQNLSRKKENGTYRIMVFGDSITFGYGVSPKKNYTTVLDKKFLNSSLHSNSVEVINSGVSGYNTLQEVELFRVRGVNYDPDLIIIGFCFNDAVINSSELIQLNAELNNQLKKYGKGLKVPFVERPEGLLKFLLEKSQLFSYVYKRLEKKKISKNYQNAFLSLANENQEKYRKKEVDEKKFAELQNNNTTLLRNLDITKEELLDQNWGNHYSMWTLDRTESIQGWSRIEYAADLLKEIQVKKDFEVLIVIFPMLLDFKKYPFRDVHKFFKSEFENMGFSVLDLLPYYSKYDVNKLYTKNRDTIHPNALGHIIAADEIFNYINENLLKQSY